MSIFRNKRMNAKRQGIPFTIAFEDVVWPERCPALGTTLEYAAGTEGRPWRDARVIPSFDRLDNFRGYVPGNVIVVSLAANTIKNQFTEAEIRSVADWLARSK